jgi:putative hydrolase of the HAD superfamily
VSFDVGGTLLEPMGSVGRVYAEVAAEFGIRASADALTRAFGLAWQARGDFDYSRGAWMEMVVRTFDGVCDRPSCESIFPRLYERFARREAWRLFPDVRPVLTRLRQDGLKLAVISNWDERLPGLLDQFDLSRYFSAVVVSAALGATKPSRLIFSAAAESLGLPPSSILHVGDSQVEDVAGAAGAGFQALHLRRETGRTNDGSIHSLAEITRCWRLEAPWPLSTDADGNG